MKRWLGIDPATKTGWSAPGDVGGVWTLSTKEEHAGLLLVRLRQHLLAAIEEHRIDAVVFEVASQGTSWGSKKEWHGMVRGIITMVAAECRIPFKFFVPTSIKNFATGSGRAEKWQMVRAFKTFVGREPIDDNEADAYFVRRMAEEGYEPEKPKKPKRVVNRRAKEPKLF